MATLRPLIHGRSVLLDDRKIHIRGVTYGTFRPLDGVPFPRPEQVRRDFEAMAEAGVNALRTYVPPPRWLLDLAAESGLHVMVGLAWEQHVAFLDDPELSREIIAKAGRQIRECEAHPAILCFAIGNEIPAPIVRWHGKRKIEGFLERLYWEAKAADPGCLVTYVNYPSTEYLELPFLDLTAFNVFLEDEDTFEAYLARLQNLSGDRPLLITEIGIDSRRNGEDAQAAALRWQVRHAFGTGACGVFVFSWTDEWHRGGHDILDWDFGLVDRERRPKRSLAAIRSAYADTPLARSGRSPRVSVVVCTHNGAATLGECLERVNGLSYPDFESIVVDDGSSDGSAEIARAHGARLVETNHRGLSHARNVGVAEASGEIVAFLDDDAYPDVDWLDYVVACLDSERHAGMGGPNLPPADDGLVAECVAAAPGGPIHVLISDREAEHVPGCNMAFRKAALEEVGGFDESFRVAGDDVDICWRLQQAGRSLGFSAGAVVMHRRRDSVSRYLKQQYGYGKAEALLERKWPGRYNRTGSSRWSGRIYDSPALGASRRRPMIRYGTWGSGLFQSIYDPAPGSFSGFLLAPESLLLILGLGLVSALGIFWTPLLVALLPFIAAVASLGWRSLSSGWHAHSRVPGRPASETFGRRMLTALLFLLQPVARLAGRLRNGLSPWRRRLDPRPAWPWPRTVEVWSEKWQEPSARLQGLQDGLAASGGYVRSGGPFDRWDLDLRTGPLGGVKLRTAVEEHGSGNQLTHVRVWPRASGRGLVIALILAFLSIYALRQGEFGFAAMIGTTLLLLVGLGIEGMGTATLLALRELSALDNDDSESGEELAQEAPQGLPADDPASAPNLPKRRVPELDLGTRAQVRRGGVEGARR